MRTSDEATAIVGQRVAIRTSHGDVTGRLVKVEAGKGNLVFLAHVETVPGEKPLIVQAKKDNPLRVMEKAAPADVGPAFASGRTRIGPEELPDGQVFIPEENKAASALKELHQYATSGETRQPVRGVVFRVVDTAEAGAIKDKTGLDVAGFTHLADNYAAQHGENEHGVLTADERQGQVPFTAEDFGKIPEVTRPENIVRTSKNRRGQDVIVYRKRYNGNWIIAEEVRTKRDQLAVVSLVKTKRGGLTSDESQIRLEPESQLRGVPPRSPETVATENGQGKSSSPSGDHVPDAGKMVDYTPEPLPARQTHDTQEIETLRGRIEELETGQAIREDSPQGQKYRDRAATLRADLGRLVERNNSAQPAAAEATPLTADQIKEAFKYNEATPEVIDAPRPWHMPSSN